MGVYFLAQDATIVVDYKDPLSTAIDVLKPDGTGGVWAADYARGKEELSIAVTVGAVANDALQLMFRRVQSASASQTAYCYYQETVVASAAVTLTAAPVTGTLTVKAPNGFTLNKVTAGTEAAGVSYSLSGNVVTFASGDNGALYCFSYDATITGVIIGGTANTRLNAFATATTFFDGTNSQHTLNLYRSKLDTQWKLDGKAGGSGQPVITAKAQKDPTAPDLFQYTPPAGAPSATIPSRPSALMGIGMVRLTSLAA